MTKSARIAAFRTRLDSFDADVRQSGRWLSLYSASIALADPPTMSALLQKAKAQGMDRTPFYEMVLQSYLFLGFPRMLIAAETLDSVYPAERSMLSAGPISSGEAQQWYDNGVRLCKQVYGDNYDALKDKVESLAPEVFRWMIVEGYGKVLSRPDVNSIDRELATVAILMMEDREQQLHSHMRGALNVGAPAELLRQVIEDLGESAEGYDTAQRLLKRMQVV